MPFMIGAGPVRRTLDYLRSGTLRLRDGVKVVTLNYNVRDKRHQGAKQFAFWEFPRIQFLNPQVQLATFINVTPTPFVRCYFEDGRSMVIDVENKTQEEIVNHLKSVVCKPEDDAQLIGRIRLDNPANFGIGCERSCICQVQGQVPCPGVVKLPKAMRGKYIYHNKDS